MIDGKQVLNKGAGFASRGQVIEFQGHRPAPMEM